MARWRRALCAGALALGVALGTTGPAPAEPAATEPESPRAETAPQGTAPPETVSVTLITGDRVVLPGGDAAQGHVVPAAGTSGRTFRQALRGDRLYVFPSVADEQVAAGTIDSSLFAVTDLIDLGYDDASSDTIPLVVRRPAGRAGREAVALRKEDAAEFFARLPRADGALGDGIEQIRLDARPREEASRPPSGERDDGTSGADEDAGTAGAGEDGRHDLTLRAVDRQGNPARFTATVEGIEYDFDGPDVVTSDGEDVTLRVRNDDYLVDMLVYSADGSEVSLMVQPVLELRDDTVWLADARRAKPVAPKVRNTSVRQVSAQLAMEFEYGVFYMRRYEFASTKGLYTGHVGPSIDPYYELRSLVSVTWARRTKGSFDGSPIVYSIVDRIVDRFLDGYAKTFRDRDLGTVKARFNAQSPGGRARHWVAGFPRDMNVGAGVGLNYDLPAKVTLRLTPRPYEWREGFSEFGRDGLETEFAWAPTLRLRKGKTIASRFNAAPFGPRMLIAERFRDTLQVRAALFVDQDGRGGGSPIDAGFTTLHRGDELVASSNSPGRLQASGLPSDRAQYRLTTEAERASHSPFATRQRVVWTFGSDEDGHPRLWSASLRPKVGAENRSSRKRAKVPLKLIPSRGAGRIDKVRVRVSADDGTTWKRVGVRATGKNAYVVAVPGQPKRATFLSVEVTAADRQGNSVMQRTIRAYGLR